MRRGATDWNECAIDEGDNSCVPPAALLAVSRSSPSAEARRPPSEVSDKERLVPSFVNVLLDPSKRGACLATLKPELLIDTVESRVCGQREEKDGYCVDRCD